MLDSMLNKMRKMITGKFVVAVSALTIIAASVAAYCIRWEYRCRKITQIARNAVFEDGTEECYNDYKILKLENGSIYEDHSEWLEPGYTSEELQSYKKVVGGAVMKTFPFEWKGRMYAIAHVWYGKHWEYLVIVNEDGFTCKTCRYYDRMKKIKIKNNQLVVYNEIRTFDPDAYAGTYFPEFSLLNLDTLEDGVIDIDGVIYPIEDKKKDSVPTKD